MKSVTFGSMEDLMSAVKTWIHDNPTGPILSCDREKETFGWSLMAKQGATEANMDYIDKALTYSISCEDYYKWAKQVEGQYEGDLCSPDARAKLAACFTGLRK